MKIFGDQNSRHVVMLELPGRGASQAGQAVRQPAVGFGQFKCWNIEYLYYLFRNIETKIIIHFNLKILITPKACQDICFSIQNIFIMSPLSTSDETARGNVVEWKDSNK